MFDYLKVFLVFLLVSLQVHAKPKKPIAMSTEWTVSSCPVNDICALDSVEFSWFPQKITDPVAGCKDSEDAYEIFIKVENKYKHQVLIDLKRFDAFRNGTDGTITGATYLTKKENIPAKSNITLSYVEKCISSKDFINNKTILTRPYYSTFSVTISQ